MSQKAEKPPDPARDAKNAGRREKHALKVWAANPKTQRLQQQHDAALRQLQILRDGTFCRQYAQMQQWCKRVEGEREAMEQQLMRVEGERTKEHIAAVAERAHDSKFKISGVRRRAVAVGCALPCTPQKPLSVGGLGRPGAPRSGTSRPGWFRQGGVASALGLG